MIEVLKSALIFIAGGAIGTFFFGGLWYTTQKAMVSRMPAMWFFPSFIIRTAITVIAFYYISNGGLQRLLVCLAGFIVSRFMVVYLTKPVKTMGIKAVKEEVT